MRTGPGRSFVSSRVHPSEFSNHGCVRRVDGPEQEGRIRHSEGKVLSMMNLWKRAVGVGRTRTTLADQPETADRDPPTPPMVHDIAGPASCSSHQRSVHGPGDDRSRGKGDRTRGETSGEMSASGLWTDLRSSSERSAHARTASPRRRTRTGDKEMSPHPRSASRRVARSGGD